MKKEDLKSRQMIGAIRGAAASMAQALETFKEHVFKVEVSNTDTELIKEVAQNTRGLKGRLDEVAKFNPIVEAIKNIKSGNTSINIPSNLNLNLKDVEVKNVVETRITNAEDIKAELKVPESIRVSNLSEINIPAPQKQEKLDISPLVEAISGLKTGVSKINDTLPSLKPKEIKIPAQKKVSFPKSMSVKEAKQIIETLSDGLQGVRDDLGQVYEAIKEIEVTGGGGKGVVAASRGGPAVTDVNINGLRGYTKTTAITVGTTAVECPATRLEHRRSVIIFNNSANTIYIGGNDVTTNNGLPVPSESYSPPIDAGETMAVYAIAASSDNNIRVLEVSSQREGA